MDICRFLDHSSWTSPGKHKEMIAPLTGDVDQVLSTINGLYLHCDKFTLYGLDERELPSRSRQTLPFEIRLDRILTESHIPLTTARSFDKREVGTCRDYALATCSLLREKSIPARVRCGFATYLTVCRYEDHWVCEYWSSQSARWIHADAQLDLQHRRELGIDFNPSEIPKDAFVTAAEAWQKIVAQEVIPELFGHGEATGTWFVWVNLVRDYFALNDVIVSPWDDWRDAIGLIQTLDLHQQDTCDFLVKLIQECEEEGPVSLQVFHPFWH